MSLPEGLTLFQLPAEEYLEELCAVFIEAYHDDAFTKVIWDGTEGSKNFEYTMSYVAPRW